MSNKRSYFQANELLAQFVPRDVLRQARELVDRIEREERFKNYLLKNFGIIFATALLFITVNSACAVVVVVFLREQLPSQFELILNISLILVAAIWIGSLLIQIYLLLAWLERRAVSEGIFLGNTEFDVIGKPPAFPWGLFVLVLAVPLSVLLWSLPQEAELAIFAIVLFAPIVYTLFDK